MSSGYRRGLVSQVDAASHRARVTFPDRQGVESPWLDVLVQDTLGAAEYGLPGVGAQVAVLLDEAEETGCVLGALYSTADPPPATTETKRVLAFSDGGRVEYDRDAHRLTVTVPDGATVELCGSDSPIALATKVHDELASLKSDLASHQHQAGLLVAPTGGGPVTGATGAPVAISYSPGDVGAAKVRSA